jgi:hypothetical protein
VDVLYNVVSVDLAHFFTSDVSCIGHMSSFIATSDSFL